MELKCCCDWFKEHLIFEIFIERLIKKCEMFTDFYFTNEAPNSPECHSYLELFMSPNYFHLICIKNMLNK